MLHEKKDYEAAADCFRRTIELRPEFSAAHNNLGTVLQDQKRPDLALEHYRKALELAPDAADALINIGSVLQMQGDMDAAVDYHRRAIAIDPDQFRAWFSLGAAAHFQHRIDEALAHYDQAIRIKPDYAEAYYNRSFVWLSQGDFAAGWKDYEWRFHCKDYQGRHFAAPRWDGSPLEGRTLLIHAEQGLGDTLQFIRYAKLVEQQSGTVVVEVQPALVPLLTASGYQRLWSPAARLCLQFGNARRAAHEHAEVRGTTLEAIPASVPYLAPDPDLVATWRDRLRSFAGFKVGIVWQGNTAYTFDHFRSIPLVQFGPLAEVDGVQLISLQKTAAPNKSPRWRTDLRSPTSRVRWMRKRGPLWIRPR